MVTEKDIEQFGAQCTNIFQQVSRDVIGQKEVVEGTIIAMIAGGNVLLEGVPGVCKTRLVRSLGRVFDLPFARIQFTPDLMPADVTGTNIIVKDENGNSKFQFQPGPIFSNIILADEINRATPKTQSALLEAMQEHTVTVMGTSRKLEEPFFVLATQNPIEHTNVGLMFFCRIGGNEFFNEGIDSSIRNPRPISRPDDVASTCPPEVTLLVTGVRRLSDRGIHDIEIKMTQTIDVLRLLQEVNFQIDPDACEISLPGTKDTLKRCRGQNHIETENTTVGFIHHALF